MKRFYFLSLFLLLTIAAQAVSVTLRVDMTGKTIAPGGVFAAGNFQVAAGGAADWTPGVVALAKQGATQVYAITVTLPAGDYQFKFLNGSNGVGQWQDAGGNQLSEQNISPNCGASGNRTVTVPNQATFSLPLYKFDSCDLSPLSNKETALEVGVSVQPNPMADFSLVTISSNAPHTIVVNNLLGQIVRQYKDVTEGQVRIEREGLNEGIYLVTIRNRAGQFTTQKLVVR